MENNKPHKDENTQEFWILYSIVLVLNFSVADNLTAAKRHGIERGTAEIIQSRYFKNVLTLK